jgi:hypothetical protein
MIIRTKPAPPRPLHEPFRHENHPRPVTRRQLLGAGFISAPAIVMAPAWLGSLLKSPLAAAALPTGLTSQCSVATPSPNGMGSTGPVPFITIDLAGGANLIGSEALVGVQGGQMNFLSAAGYAKLGIPGNLVPDAAGGNVDTSLGLAFHSTSAILAGIKSKAAATTLAGVNGVVIPAMSQNDTGNNPLNAMYAVAKAAQTILDPVTQKPATWGSLVTLCGTQSSVSGGNSASPAAFNDPTLQPTKIASATDDVGLVSSGSSTVSPDMIAAMEAQVNISGGSDPATFQGSVLGTDMLTGDTTADGKLATQVRCAYVKSAATAAAFNDPSKLNPDLDMNVTGATGVFNATDYKDGDVKKAAAVMKLVMNGFAGAGTITLGGYDYHDSTRTSGMAKNTHAGVIIGGILEYAARVKTPVMIQIISDGSLTSTGKADANANGLFGWQGDSQQTAASIILVYSPKGRPALRNGAASNQIGFMNADGTVNAMSSPAANANNLLVQVAMLNWMALNGVEAQFESVFPQLNPPMTQGLGAPMARDALTSFTKIT